MRKRILTISSANPGCLRDAMGCTLFFVAAVVSLYKVQSFVNVVVSKEKKASHSTITMTDTRVPILCLRNGLTNV